MRETLINMRVELYKKREKARKEYKLAQEEMNKHFEETSTMTDEERQEYLKRREV